jgi:hypothetical protein
LRVGEEENIQLFQVMCILNLYHYECLNRICKESRQN